MEQPWTASNAHLHVSEVHVQVGQLILQPSGGCPFPNEAPQSFKRFVSTHFQLEIDFVSANNLKLLIRVPPTRFSQRMGLFSLFVTQFGLRLWGARMTRVIERRHALNISTVR